jgi:hypothetical protein
MKNKYTNKNEMREESPKGELSKYPKYPKYEIQQKYFYYMLTHNKELVQSQTTKFIYSLLFNCP